MHSYVLPQWAEDRIVRRQGRPIVHDDVPANRTALVVVDLQNYFMIPGAPAEVPQSRTIVSNVNRLAATLRDAGGVVVWIRTVFSPEARETIAHFHTILLLPEFARRRSEWLAPDAEGAQLWPDLEVKPEDLVVLKTRYSAFSAGASDLAAQLQARNIDAVLVAGTMTNVCCDTTARDAMMLNFRTTMISDACASLTDDEHAAALTHFHLQFGDVVPTDDLMQRYR